MAACPLSHVRDSLRRSDQETPAALKRRLGIVRNINETKRTRGLPVRDYAVERQVVGRWRCAMGVIEVPSEERIADRPERLGTAWGAPLVVPAPAGAISRSYGGGSSSGSTTLSQRVPFSTRHDGSSVSRPSRTNQRWRPPSLRWRN